MGGATVAADGASRIAGGFSTMLNVFTGGTNSFDPAREVFNSALGETYGPAVRDVSSGSYMAWKSMQAASSQIMASKEAAQMRSDFLASQGNQQGDTVYRVWGGDSKLYGHSWTRTNPLSTDNYRNAAGLPPGNTGRYMTRGRLINMGNVFSRDALPIGKNLGGLDELLVPNVKEQIIIETTKRLRPGL